MSAYDPKNHIDRLEPRQKPDVSLMLREVRDAVNGANALGVFKKMQICHHTRNCWWRGQMDDGRKAAPNLQTKENLYHWEGAPETRRHKADEIIIERAGLREMVLHRGSATVAPHLDALGNDGQQETAERWQMVLDHFINRTRRATAYVWKLFSSCVEEFGYGVLHWAFEKEKRNAQRKITSDQFISFITADVTQSMIGEDGDPSTLTPEQIADIQTQATLGYAAALRDDADGRALGVMLLQAYDPAISESEARVALRELAKDDEAIYFVPEDGDGLPVPMALIPWVNFIHPAHLTGGGKADWGCVPEWITGPELQSANRGYRKSWVKRALDYPNKTLPELLSVSLENVYGWVLNGAGIGLHIDQNYVQQNTPVYLVLHVWRRAIDKDGHMTVFRTVLHPLVDDDYGLHEATGLTEIPFLIETAEPTVHAMLSRGVGEIVVAAQNQVIDLMDSEGARGQLGSNPPLKRSVNEHVPVRPGMQMFIRSAGLKDATEFLQTPHVDEGSLKLIEIAERFVDNRFFRAENTDPDIKQQQRQLLAFSALMALQDFYAMLFHVIQVNVDELDGQEVDLRGRAHVEIEFNVAGLSQDAADKWLDTITKLLSIDPGVIDRAAATKDVVRLANPVMAKRLIMSDEAAAGKIRADQLDRITRIMNGWKPTQADYPERQSNPQLRLQVMQEYVNDPWNQQRLQAPMNGDAMQIMEQEMKYLQDQQVQYQQNPMIGRSLVSAKTPEEMAGEQG